MSERTGSRNSIPSVRFEQHFVSPNSQSRLALREVSSATFVVTEGPGGKSRISSVSPNQRLHDTLKVTSLASAKNIRSHFPYPSARDLVVRMIIWTMARTSYVFTAWLFCSIQRETLFPRCSVIWDGYGPWASWSCMATSLLLWTFPLICCVVALLFNYRDLLHSRLYYEMFSHRVHLDFMNIGFFEASMVQVLIGWMVLSLLMYPMTSALTFKHVLVTLPYWLPVISFGVILWMQWDLETRLLSVAKFIEDDVEWANTHMLESFFLKDYVAAAALNNVMKTLEQQSPAPQLTMGEFITDIAEEAERMHLAGEEPDEKLAHRTLSSSWSSQYWVQLIVNNDCHYLVDEEANEFRWWFFIYKVFTIVLICALLSLGFTTAVTHLHRQGVVSTSVLTEWVNLDYLSMLPVRTQPQTSALAAVVTPGLYHPSSNFTFLAAHAALANSLLSSSTHQAIWGARMPTMHSLHQPAQHSTQIKAATVGQTRDEAARPGSNTKSTRRKHKRNPLQHASNTNITD